MCSSARLFQCARCFTQTLICHHCDRGQPYCSARCSGQARRDSHNRANRHYAHSRQGKLKNAERQRRYRAQTQKVTDQGSSPPPIPVSWPRWVKTPVLNRFYPVVTRAMSRLCHFCFARLSDFLRTDFLHRQTDHPRW